MNRKNGLDFIIIAIGLVIVISLSYGGFRLYRWFNWEFSYKSNVKSSILLLVKPECLKKEVKSE